MPTPFKSISTDSRPPYNPDMLFEQITIVGVGLIGGSVGLAVKARKVARCVVGTGRDAANLAKCSELGAIDRGTTDLAVAVQGSDLIVVCTPVDRIAQTILGAAPYCKAGAIFTDGGSTKLGIAEAVGTELPRGIAFVPAHPLAGSEKNGVDNARADLFENRLTILTPIQPAQGMPAPPAERVAAFWQALGSRVLTMTPDAHDRALACTSHVPHAVAAAAARATPVEWLPLSAGGFRDVTRIAGGDPELWAAIFQANRDAVIDALANFTTRLDEFRRLLESGDGTGLRRWLAEAKQVRDALGT
jgi:cyclohexadieny/prephenate dehydrogenase